MVAICHVEVKPQGQNPLEKSESDLDIDNDIRISRPGAVSFCPSVDGLLFEQSQ